MDYHGARYYALWLGRWTSTDPSGLNTATNLYRFSHDNPICFIDLNGQDPVSVGKAGDLPAAATLEDLKQYAFAHGKIYSDPDNKRTYKDGQWQGGTLAERDYAHEDASGEFGRDDRPKTIAPQTIPAGPYSTDPNSGQGYDLPSGSGGGGASKIGGGASNAATGGNQGSGSGGSGRAKVSAAGEVHKRPLHRGLSEAHQVRLAAESSLPLVVPAVAQGMDGTGYREP